MKKSTANREAVHLEFSQDYAGVRRWIDENIGEDQHAAAITKFESVMSRARKDPELYPPRYLLTTFMAGAFRKEILPLNRKKVV